MPRSLKGARTEWKVRMETPTDASPAEPDISHVNPWAERTWLGHPRQLARLFSIEM